MRSHSVCASMHIFMGGLGLLLNVAATIVTIKRVKRPHNSTVTVLYKISDTISGALASLILFCDGFLYFGQREYTYSCYRYFVIYFLIVFSITTSNSSILGAAIDHYLTAKNANIKSTSCQKVFCILWTATYWFTTAAFIIIIWGNTEKDVKHLDDSTFNWKRNELLRFNRGLLDDLWAHNSQNDWSSDFRENAIIGLVYGIIGGNISHEALKKFHGNTPSAEKNQQQIKKLHAALGIPDSDFHKIFGTNLSVNSQHSNSTTDKSTAALKISTNSAQQWEHHSDSSIILGNSNTSNIFKPSHGITINKLQQNSLSNHTLQNQNINTNEHHDVPTTLSRPQSLTNVNIAIDAAQNNSTNHSSIGTHLITSQETGSESNITFPNIRNNGNSDSILQDTSLPNDHKELPEGLIVIRTEVPNPEYQDITSTPLTVTTTPKETDTIPDTVTESEHVATSTDTPTELFTAVPITKNSSFTTNPPKTTEEDSMTKNPNINNSQVSTSSTYDQTEIEGPLQNPKITSACNTWLAITSSYTIFVKHPSSYSIFFQVGFLPAFITIIIICVYGLPLLVSGFLDGSLGWNNQRCISVNQLNSRHSNKLIIQTLARKGFIILVVNFICWTPFLLERLFSAWERTSARPTTVSSSLFILAQAYNVLRAVFYIYDNEEVNMQGCPFPASRCCSTTVLPLDNAQSEIIFTNERTEPHNFTSNEGMPAYPSQHHAKSIPMVNLRHQIPGGEK
ncbi:uncharacterized protein [Palaemon carinicauda]|uniref:uncharacterized protein n=1 Tax=Palaemon carinicauda TaxID=392227 RepID=UPI0035B5A0F4